MMKSRQPAAPSVPAAVDARPVWPGVLSVPARDEHRDISPLAVTVGDHLQKRGVGWWVNAVIPADRDGLRAVVIRAEWDRQGTDPALYPGRHLSWCAYEVEGPLAIAKPVGSDAELATHRDRLTNPAYRSHGDRDSWVSHNGAYFPALTTSQLAAMHKDYVGSSCESIMALDPVTGGTVLTPYALYDDNGRFLRISFGCHGPEAGPVRFKPMAPGALWQCFRYDVTGTNTYVHFMPELSTSEEAAARTHCPLGADTFERVYTNALRPSLHYPFDLVYQHPGRVIDVAEHFSARIGKPCGVHPRSLSAKARSFLAKASVEDLASAEQISPAEAVALKERLVLIVRGDAICPVRLAVWAELHCRQSSCER